MSALDAPSGGQVSQILEANEQFVASSSPIELSHKPARRLAIVACMDCRLSGGFLEEALGIERGDAVILRNAGSTTAANDDVLRSLVQAVYGLGVREVVVVGHTGCGMANLDTTAFLDAMSAAGVPRDAIPAADLRGWIGAFGRVQDNVVQTMDNIRHSGLFPGDLQVHGLVLDTLTGKAEQVPQEH